MNNLEKMLFLEMTNKQFLKPQESTYLATYKTLTKEEHEEFTKLSHELHDIWNFINSKPVLNVIDNTGIDSIQDYNDKVVPVSEMIMALSRDFGLNLKDEMPEEVKKAIIAIFGEEYYLKNYTK